MAVTGIGGELLANGGVNWVSRVFRFVAMTLLLVGVLSILLWSFFLEHPDRLSGVQLAHRVESALMLAALVLPGWGMWRLPRYYLSLPLGTLIFWGLVVNAGWFIMGLDREYDSIAPGLMLFAAGPMGGVYCLLCLGVCEAISPLSERRGKVSRPTRANRTHAIAGLTVWAALCLFAFLLPFVRPPLQRRRDPTFPRDYFSACWPILLLALTMFLMYALSLGRLWLRRQLRHCAEGVCA